MPSSVTTIQPLYQYPLQPIHPPNQPVQPPQPRVASDPQGNTRQALIPEVRCMAELINQWERGHPEYGIQPLCTWSTRQINISGKGNYYTRRRVMEEWYNSKQPANGGTPYDFFAYFEVTPMTKVRPLYNAIIRRTPDRRKMTKAERLAQISTTQRRSPSIMTTSV